MPQQVISELEERLERQGSQSHQIEQTPQWLGGFRSPTSGGAKLWVRR